MASGVLPCVFDCSSEMGLGGRWNWRRGRPHLISTAKWVTTIITGTCLDMRMCAPGDVVGHHAVPNKGFGRRLVECRGSWSRSCRKPTHCCKSKNNCWRWRWIEWPLRSRTPLPLLRRCLDGRGTAVRHCTIFTWMRAVHGRATTTVLDAMVFLMDCTGALNIVSDFFQKGNSVSWMCPCHET